MSFLTTLPHVPWWHAVVSWIRTSATTFSVTDFIIINLFKPSRNTRQITDCQILMYMYKAMNGLSPQYLADDCQLITTTGRREPAQLWAIDPSLLLEQSTTSSPWLWTITFRVSPVTENAFVWLKIAAPSDLLLDVMRFLYKCTYLLTYLLTSVYYETHSVFSLILGHPVDFVMRRCS